MSEEWPREPWRRRTVLVLGDADIDFLKHEGGGEVLLNEEVLILQYPMHEGSPILPIFDRRGQRLHRGDVLIQSPYDDERYEAVEDSVREFAREKCGYVVRVCHLLGATKFKLVQESRRVEKEQSRAKEEHSGRFNAKGVKGEASFQKSAEVARELIEELRLSVAGESVGGAPDVTAAEKLVREKNLVNDVDLMNLIQMRRHANNPLKNLLIKVSFVEAKRHAEKTMASLDVNALYQVVSASYHTTRENTNQWSALIGHEVKLSVEF